MPEKEYIFIGLIAIYQRRLEIEPELWFSVTMNDELNKDINKNKMEVMAQS